MENGQKPAIAYKIDLNKIEEGFLFSDVVCHAESLNKAKYKLLEKVRYDGMKLKYYDEELSYLNIPVVRHPDADLVEFEGDFITQDEISQILHQRERLNRFESILADQNISHCYIRKHGNYYMPNGCGYTQLKVRAGIYTKEDAIGHGKSCGDLQIIPINIQEHNEMIESEIQELTSKIINE